MKPPPPAAMDTPQTAAGGEKEAYGIKIARCCICTTVNNICPVEETILPVLRTQREVSNVLDLHLRFPFASLTPVTLSASSVIAFGEKVISYNADLTFKIKTLF